MYGTVECLSGILYVVATHVQKCHSCSSCSSRFAQAMQAYQKIYREDSRKSNALRPKVLSRAESRIESNQTNSPADGESKHKNKPGFDTLGSTRSPFATTFEANYDEGVRHSERRGRFRQLGEYKVQFGHCLVPRQYSANPRLGTWVRYRRARYRKSTEEENSTCMIAEHIRALEGIGFDWGISMTDLVSIWSVRFQQLCEFKTVSCQSSILPTPSLGIGFRLSTGTTDCTRKEIQVP